MADSRLTFDLLGRDRVTPATKSAGRGVDKLGRKFSGLGSRIGLFSRIGARSLGIFSTGLAAAGIAGATMGIKTAASLEQANIAFSTLLGSGKKAKKFLTDLKKFAAATPFELPGLVDSSRLLIGVGKSTKDTMEILQAFGDTAGAVGIGQEEFQRAILATSQSISAGKIKLGEINQLMNAGLPIWKLLAEATGKPVPELQKLISKGKLLTKDVLPKLLKQMKKDYGGAMAKQSQTLTGLWSTFMDTINLGLASVLEPFIPFLKTTLAGAIGVAGDAFGKIPEAVSGAVEAVKGFAKKIDISGFVKKGKDLFKAAKAWGSTVVDGIIEGAKTGDWNDLGKTIATGLAAAFAATINLGAMLVDLFGKVDWFSVGKAVGRQAASFALGFITTLVDGIIDAAVHHPGDFALALISALGIGAVGSRIASVLRKIPFLRSFAPLFDGLQKLTGPLNRAIGRVVAIFGSGFKQGFAKHFPGVYSILRRRLGDTVAAIQLYTEAFFNAGARLVRGLGRGIGSMFGWAVRQLGRLPKMLIHRFASSGSWLFQAGANLIGGFIAGIRSKVGELLGTVGDIAGKVRDFLPFSPAKRGPLSGRGNPFYSGQSIGRLLSKGMVASRGEVAGSARALAGTARVNGSATMVTSTGMGSVPVGGSGPMRLHPADIRALGEVMGRVVLTGLGAANVRSARAGDLYARAG